MAMTPTTSSAMPLSITHLAAGTPWWIYAIVIAALTVHIGGGGVAIVAGYGAVSVRKGGRLHRTFGKVFVAAMLAMATVAAALAIFIQQRSNIAAGILAGYLVATAWLTVKPRSRQTIALERAATLVPVGLAVLFFVWGVEAVRNGGKLEGYASPFYFIFAGIAALFVLLDAKVMLRGGVAGAQRIARHLWRMCFALFFAAGSFFLGQQKVMPAWMHGSPLLFIPALAPLALMIFWLIRVRMKRRPKTIAAQTAAIPSGS
jgi:uncharacterized membrane protein